MADAISTLQLLFCCCEGPYINSYLSLSTMACYYTLPIMATSPQQSLSCVSKVANVERFICISRMQHWGISAMENISPTNMVWQIGLCMVINGVKNLILNKVHTLYQVWIHTGFHCFAEIGHISVMHNNIFFHNTSQVKIWPWPISSLNYLKTQERRLKE